MDSVDEVKNITDFLGGGWLSIVIGVLAVVIIAWLKMAEKKAKRDDAERETDFQRQKEQADTADKNQDLQDKWDDASEDISNIRKEAHKNGGTSDSN